MFKNYLKVAVRNLLKHKSYTLINALGLSIGIGSCLFIILVSHYEIGVDGYHSKKDNIYRLTDHIHDSSGKTYKIATTPLPWGPALQRDYPEIEKFVRYLFNGHVVRYNETVIRESFLYSDPAIFEIFDYKLLEGDPGTVLVEPNSIVISTEIAEKYFPGEDPVGKALLIDNKSTYTVTGLMDVVPNNSSLQFSILASMSTLNVQNQPLLENWRTHACQTYLLLSENASPESLQSRLPDFIKTYIDAEFHDRYRPQLQRFMDIHFTTDYASEWSGSLNFAYIYIFLGIAFFILFIACINFMNLATARSEKRAKEVGMRKVMGAFKSQIIRQFLAETFIISFVALLLALLMVESALPWYNSLTEREVEVEYFANFVYIAAMFGITLLVGILAGSYPAFFLSAIMPVKVLKGEAASGKKGSRLRKTLVVGQFTVAIFMIIANTVLIEQIDFLKNKDLGFRKENIINFFTPSNHTPERRALIRADLQQHPNIIDFALTSAEPGDGYAVAKFIPEGFEEQGVSLANIAVDSKFLDVMDIPLVLGRNFSEEIASDASNAVIINETAVREFGWDNPIGKTIKWIEPASGSERRIVIGVIEDYHIESLHRPIRPLVLHAAPGLTNRYLIRAKEMDIDATTEYIFGKWKEYDPNNPPGYYYLDVDLAVEYEFEEVIGSLLVKFTFLTIFIAGLGLLGLASFTAQQRTREIGVRKVLGATISGVVVLVSKEFIKYVVIANVVAWPLAYTAMKFWLTEFAYQVNISMPIFLISGVLSFLLALLTVGYQVIKAGFANPVKSLRYE